jgi:hypothetical protein
MAPGRQSPCRQLRLAGIAADAPIVHASRRPSVKELVRYLFENLYFDFQGDISVDKVRDFLREDDSREARQLLSKIIEEKGVDDLLITLADVLKDHIRTGVSEQNIRDQLSTYSES